MGKTALMPGILWANAAEYMARASNSVLASRVVGIDVDDFFRRPVCLLGRDVVRFGLLGFGCVDLKLGFHIRRHIGGVKGKGKDGEEEQTFFMAMFGMLSV